METNQTQEANQVGKMVLEALLEQYPEDVPLPDRISVEQGTETQWACRVYHPGSQEFTGVIISLD